MLSIMESADLMGMSDFERGLYENIAETASDFEKIKHEAFAYVRRYDFDYGRSQILWAERFKHGTTEQREWIRRYMQETRTTPNLNAREHLTSCDYGGNFKDATKCFNDRCGHYDKWTTFQNIETDEHFEYGDVREYIGRCKGRISADSELVWSARHEYGSDEQKAWIENLFKTLHQEKKATLLKSGNYDGFYNETAKKMGKIDAPITAIMPEEAVLRRSGDRTLYRLPDDGDHEGFTFSFPNCNLKSAVTADGRKVNVAVFDKYNTMDIENLRTGERRDLPASVFAKIMNDGVAKGQFKTVHAPEHETRSSGYAMER